MKNVLHNYEDAATEELIMNENPSSSNIDGSRDTSLTDSTHTGHSSPPASVPLMANLPTTTNGETASSARGTPAVSPLLGAVSSSSSPPSSNHSSVFADAKKEPTTFSEIMYYEITRCDRWKYYGSHAWREMKKRKFNYCLGCCSCFIVVAVAAVCYTLIAKAPAVFLQQGESTAGQIDMLLKPSDASRAPFLNLTQLAINAAVSSEFSYFTARTAFNTYAYSVNCTKYLTSLNVGMETPSGLLYRYDGPPGNTVCGNTTDECISKLCRTYKPVITRLIDTNREKEIGLGRNWPYQRIPKGQALIRSDVASIRDIVKGSTVWLSIVLDDVTSPLLTNALFDQIRNTTTRNSTDELLQTVRAYPIVSLPVTVMDVFSDTFGKFSSTDDDNLIVMELDTFLPWMMENLHPRINSVNLTHNVGGNIINTNASSILSRINIREYSSSIPVNLPPRRTDVYIDSNYDVVQRRLINFASRALYFIGFPDVNVTLDILSTLYELRFFTIYLGLILSIILTILFILSAMLIYSLLMISIETRTFELGIHRMVGMSRFSVIEMLLSQACSYSLPAWVVGLIFAQIVVRILLNIIEANVQVPITKFLTPDSIGLATGLGLLIPLIAAVVPIRNALNQNLHDALDTLHSKTLAVKVSIERSEEDGLSAPWLVVGIGMFTFGFLIYYLLPLSLLSFNLTLFFNIFFGILLGLLFGLILLALNAQHLLEQLTTYLFLWWEKRPIRNLALKNLVAHRVRNRKTTMMFALALGFIIFITVTFDMELKSAEFRTLKATGSKIKLSSNWDIGITRPAVAELEQLAITHPAVQDFAWSSRHLAMENKLIDDFFLTNIGHVAEGAIHIWAVSPNFFSVTYTEFLITADSWDTGLSLSEQMYTMRGSQSMIVSSGLKDSHDITDLTYESSFLTVPKVETAFTNNSLNIRRMKPLALLDSAPKFAFSRFPTTRNQDVLVSFPTLVRISQGLIRSVDDLRMDSIYFKIKSGASEATIDDLTRQLGLIKDSYQDLKIEDVRDFSGALQRTQATMTIIFSVATYIAMALCLFSLMASMFTNIFEQSKEIAVLRAMGMTRWQVTRIYIYEAFILVFASASLGVLIGAVMAWTMALQRVLFTQLPITVQFPWPILIVVLIGAVMASFVSSYAPATNLLKRPVAQVMRTVV